MHENFPDDELTAYVLGILPSDRVRAIEVAASSDDELKMTLRMMGALLGDVQRLEKGRRWPHSLLRTSNLLAAVALISVGLTIYYYDRASEARDSSIRLASENGRLKSEVLGLLPDHEIVEAAQPIDGKTFAISFLRPEATSAQPPQGEASLSVQNVTFPCILQWKSGKATESIEVPVSGLERKLPSGDLVLTVRPLHFQGWFQSFGIVHNDEYLGSSLGTALLKVKNGDRIRLHFDQPFPPWNATMLRVRGVWVIVTLERPWARFDLEKFRTGNWKGAEQFPNTALFWARDSSDGLARELAEAFVAQRDEKGRHGRFRGEKHTSMIVPATVDGVIRQLRDMTVEDLVQPLTQAFEALRQQRPPLGPTIQEEIDAARLLAQRLKANP